MKHRYRWKRCLSIVCIMALLGSMIYQMPVQAEELPEKSGQKISTEIPPEMQENSADTENTETAQEVTECLDDTETVQENTECSDDTETAQENTECSDDTELPQENTEILTDTEMPDESTESPEDTENTEGELREAEETVREDTTDTETSEETVIDAENNTIEGDTVPDGAAIETAMDYGSVTADAEMLTYTDGQGNVFTYQSDEDGNITIIGITVSGGILSIPETIGESPVTAVADADHCVVSNPEVFLSELRIDCHTIGSKAFQGLSIGTLIIGEHVKELSLSHSQYSYYYEQFWNCTIGKVIFNAVELTTGYRTDNYNNDFYGPFYQAEIGDLEIGSLVTVIPEKMFQDSTMELDTLEVRAERIGALAFSSKNITIEHLILGEEVKVMAEYSNSEKLSHQWGQFSYSRIGTFTYLANDMELEYIAEKTSYSNMYAPFWNSVVGTLELGSNITRIPELFLYHADIIIEELDITQSSVGAYAFSGSDIQIGTLILNTTAETLEESGFSTYLFQHWEQFSYSTIGCVRLETPALELEKALEKTESSPVTVYGPFYNTVVQKLEIGDGVERIPDYFFQDTVMDMEELRIHVPVIGAAAFSSEKISFGKLLIGEEVTVFQESSYSWAAFHYWNQFQKCTIGQLIYQAKTAQVVNDSAEIESRDTNFYGPFEGAVIVAFTLGTEVTVIPDFLLKDAAAQIEELDLQVSEIGAMAFMGAKISIGRLRLSREGIVFRKSPNSLSSYSYRYWEQFAQAAIEELHYSVPSLELEGEKEGNYNCKGPFYSSRIGKLYLSEEVERYPAYVFLDACLQQEELSIHAKSIGVSAFSGSNISIGTLTIGDEVETFESVLSGYQTYYQQFKNCTVGNLVYLPVSAVTGVECSSGIFENAVIRNLTIGEEVETIPHYLFMNAKMELKELSIHVGNIGVRAFSGSNISIETLTIGKEIESFSYLTARYLTYYSQFASCKIGNLVYLPVCAATGTEGNYGVFDGATIGNLTIGESVETIPPYLFMDTKMELGELALHVKSVGTKSFSSRYISIETLTLGEEIESFPYLTARYLMYYSQFANCKIGNLIYRSVSAVTGEKGNYGVFDAATIGNLTIDDKVEVIPDYLFYNAKMELEDITLNVPVIGSYSFAGKNLVFHKLTIGEAVTLFRANQTKNNLAFQSSTIEELVYLPAEAKTKLTNSNVYGPFCGSNITKLIIGENVAYLDFHMFDGNAITDCYVYAVNGSELFKSQELYPSYLPVCTDLHIHYNSDLKDFFAKKVTEYHWMCVDYFDTTYGEKIFDEETGAYLVEVFQTCSVCGYEKEERKELDSSYDVHLSVPVEITLAFDEKTKSYVGNEWISAYGTLGDAYEGIRLVVETESDTYGNADKEGDIYDISDFLKVEFTSGETAVFDREQLRKNAALQESGETENMYQEQMSVAVDALGFLKSGAGNYRISIPLRFEIYD